MPQLGPDHHEKLQQFNATRPLWRQALMKAISEVSDGLPKGVRLALVHPSYVVFENNAGVEIKCDVKWSQDGSQCDLSNVKQTGFSRLKTIFKRA